MNNSYVQKIIFLSLSIFLFINIMVILIYSKSQARYVTNVYGDTNVKVASLDMNLHEDNIITFNTINKSTEPLYYHFTVNNDGDTNMIYRIKIQTEHNLPLIYELYRTNDNEESNNLLLNDKTDEFIINYSNSDSYKLKIYWDINDINYLYSYEVDNFKVIVDSYQKD